MSTIEANNIKKGAKTIDTDYVLDGCAKAWANLNGTGTIAIRDSMNVSSVTDLGTGYYGFSLTNSFSAFDYSVNSLSSRSASSDQRGSFVDTNSTASEVRISELGNTFYDVTYLTMTAHGDLA